MIQSDFDRQADDFDSRADDLMERLIQLRIKLAILEHDRAKAQAVVDDWTAAELARRAAGRHEA